MANKNSYTAVITKSEDGWYTGQIPEHPEVLTQGKTLKELEENLADALREVLEMKQEEYQKGLKQANYKVIRRKIFA